MERRLQFGPLIFLLLDFQFSAPSIYREREREGGVGGDWAFSWTPRYRLGTPANPIKSAYHYGWRIRITKGATVVDYDVLDPFQPSFTLTAAQQTADFGGSLASPFDVDVMALNQFTGAGRALSETL